MDLALPPKVTDRAYARLREICEATGEEKALRVAVEGGGCSGFQYDIKLDDPATDDLVLEKDGARVLVDAVSLPFLQNAVIVRKFSMASSWPFHGCHLRALAQRRFPSGMMATWSG